MISSQISGRTQSCVSSLARRSFSTSSPAFRGKLDKRIPVQLLRDFPGLGYKGEVVKVLPGRMRNQLHRNNGAAYVLENEPLRIELVKRETIQAVIDAENAAKLELEKQALETQRKELRERATSRKNTREEMLSALESLGDLNIAFPSKQKESALESSEEQLESEPTQAQPAESIPEDEKAEVTSLYFLESTLRSLPVVVAMTADANSQGFISPKHQLTTTLIASHISTLLGIAIDPSTVTIPIPSKSSQRQQQASAIDFVGSHQITISLSNGRSITKTIRVAPSNINAHKSLANWQSLVRPSNTPYPGLSTKTAAAQKPAAADAAPKQKAETETTEDKSTAKTFEWENDLINKISR